MKTINANYQKLQGSETPWQHDNGIREKILATQPSSLKELQLDEGCSVEIEIENEAGVLLVLVSGCLSAEDDQQIDAGDLLWMPQGESATLTAAQASHFYELVLPAGSSQPKEHVQSSQIAWQSFDDPAGRPTQPVQVLMEGEVSVLRTRFDPDYVAGEHWHDFSTWYFITDGNMMFGHEGWYQTGDVRQVNGGYSYGPELPGETGVEFVLVSVGGPVNLHWQDLEASPHGAL